MTLTDTQLQSFETFGFLKFPGLMLDSIESITAEFHAVFEQKHVEHDGTQRSRLVPFIDQREHLCALLDDPRLIAIADALLGANWNYIGGDGNFYTGNTNWHSDGFHDVGRFLKMAFYLDPVTRETGALRVIPGSHVVPHREHWKSSGDLLWALGADVPAVALESRPGDLLVFNHNLWHAAFGGSSRRRMFTINLCRRCETGAEIDDLKNYIGSNARFWNDTMHSDLMRETAGPQRWTHLQQVVENEGHLPALAAQARQKMAEPSRG